MDASRRRAIGGLAGLTVVLGDGRGRAAAARELPNTMLAAAFDRGGGPEVLSLHRLALPRLKPDEVLIAVHAAGVASWDASERRQPAADAHFPVVLGTDGSGTIAAAGFDVRDLKAGEAVYGVPGSGCYAQYVRARAQDVARLPAGIDLDHAGILAVSGLSALQGIDAVLQMQPGETLIIHGASGGVGTLAVQFARLRAVRVLATATNEAGLSLLRRLGTHAVVNGRSGGVAAAARQFAPDGVDAVLGLAGGDALETCIDALRDDHRGRVAYLYGVEPLPRPRLYVRMTLYSFICGRQELRRLNQEVEAAHLQVPIAAEFPLAEAAQAHRRLEAGHLLGKIALRVAQ